MLDASLRELEHSLRSSPHDPVLAQRYLQTLRRSGAVGPDAPPELIEPLPNPGIVTGDLVLVARRSRPRAAFAWLPEMDALVGTVGVVRRLQPRDAFGERDGLSVLLDGPSLVAVRGSPALVVGRSFGFASLVPIRR